jgi:hypothetical protein
MPTFREAVEARDMAAVEAMLAEDVVFLSPVAFKPYRGRPLTAAILRAVVEVFEKFHYVREIGDAQSREHALVFEAEVDGLQLTGCDHLRYGEDGRITELMVMVRPLRAAQALAERMAAKFEQIQSEASAR